MLRRHTAAPALLVATLLLAAGCSQPSNPAAPAAALDAGSAAHAPSTHGPGVAATVPAHALVNSQLAEVRAATAKYHNFQTAWDEGFRPVSPCVPNMGFHYGLQSRIENPAINHLEPEVLLYAPDKHGRLRLVAVEWIVPEPIWPGGAANPPNLFGLDFHPGPPPLLILHAWIWHDNPDGMFADFNPRITC